MAKGTTTAADSPVSASEPQEPVSNGHVNGNGNGNGSVPLMDEVRTTPYNIGPDRNSLSLLAAWNGLYHVFGFRCERFDLASEGVFCIGLTLPRKFSLNQILSDIEAKRVNLIPAALWATGQIPDAPNDLPSLTAFMAYFRGAGEENTLKTPDYVKKAVADYRKQYGLGKPRGRQRKVLKFEIEQLENLDPTALIGVPPNKLDALRKRIEEAMARQQVSV